MRALRGYIEEVEVVARMALSRSALALVGAVRPGNILVYQPGGTAGLNVFTNFRALCAVAKSIAEPALIFFDASKSPVVATCHIPNDGLGDYDFGGDVSWMGRLADDGGTGTIITSDAGVRFAAPGRSVVPTIFINLDLRFTGPTSTSDGVFPIVDTRQVLFQNVLYSGDQTTTTGIIFNVKTGNILQVQMIDDSEWLDTFPTVATTLAAFAQTGAELSLIVFDGSAIFTTTVGGAAGANILGFIVSEGAGISAVQPSISGGTFPVRLVPLQGGFAETILIGALSSTASVGFTPIGGRSLFYSDLTFPPFTEAGATARVIQFVADVQLVGGATRIDIKLVDQTHGGTDIAGSALFSTSARNTVTSGPLTVGAVAGDIRNDVNTWYDVEVKATGGTVNCSNARLVTTYQ